jgi:hypothetical protein
MYSVLIGITACIMSNQLCKWYHYETFEPSIDAVSKPNTCIFRTKVLVRKVFSLDWFHCMYIYVLIQLFLSCLISCINCNASLIYVTSKHWLPTLLSSTSHQNIDSNASLIYITSKHWLQTLLSSTSHQNIDHKRFSHLRHIKTLITNTSLI